MHARSEMYNAIDIAVVRAPALVDAGEVRRGVDPLGNAPRRGAGASDQSRNSMAVTSQHTAQCSSDEAVCSSHYHMCHSHFQPNRLKKRNADKANILTCAPPLRDAPPP